MSRTLLACTSIASAAILACAALLTAGPLNPPVGPVSSTYKTLTEVEPRTLVNATNTPGSASAIFVITQPGSYYLGANVVGVNGRNGIEIRASDVTLDLNGFEVIGNFGLDGIAVTLANQNSIAVMNGSVRGWTGDGIDFTTTFTVNTRVIDVRAEGNSGFGINVANTYTLDRCTARGNGAGGFSCANHGIMHLCQAMNNTGTGIVLGQGATVSDCLSSFNSFGTGDGIRSGGYCTITNCDVVANPGNGIITGPVSTVTNCTVDGSNVNGIQTGNGSTVSGCSVNFGQNFNIVVGSGSTVADCTVQFGNLGGIECAGQCVIRGNACASNANGSGTGPNIHATGTDSRIEGNTCTGAFRGIKVDAAGNFIARNACSGNTSNYDVAAGNIILVVSATAAPAVLGSAGGAAPGSTDPNANFSY